MKRNRRQLREKAMTRAGNRCEFPHCPETRNLELAHLKASGSGGSRYRDDEANVAMLCALHHDWLDLRENRIMRRRFDNEAVLRAALDRWWEERR